MTTIIEDFTNPKVIVLILISAIVSAFGLFILIACGITGKFYSHYVANIFDVVILNTVAGFTFGMFMAVLIINIKMRYIDKPKE